MRVMYGRLDLATGEAKLLGQASGSKEKAQVKMDVHWYNQFGTYFCPEKGLLRQLLQKDCNIVPGKHGLELRRLLKVWLPGRECWIAGAIDTLCLNEKDRVAQELQKKNSKVKFTLRINQPVSCGSNEVPSEPPTYTIVSVFAYTSHAPRTTPSATSALALLVLSSEFSSSKSKKQVGPGHRLYRLVNVADIMSDTAHTEYTVLKGRHGGLTGFKTYAKRHAQVDCKFDSPGASRLAAGVSSITIIAFF